MNRSFVTIDPRSEANSITIGNEVDTFILSELSRTKCHAIIKSLQEDFDRILIKQLRGLQGSAKNG